LPTELNDFIQRATQKDPSMRHQNMGQVLADLKRLAEKSCVSATVEGGSSHEKMALVMSYRDVDQLELTRLVEDFRERLKHLGVELGVTSLQRD
jgi:hypothetical protein